jgi:hypothetical protein
MSRLVPRLGLGDPVLRPAQTLLWGSILGMSLTFFATPLDAQPARTPPLKLRVFLDCSYECDTEYIRQNIEFIDYVRDRETADLHVLVTTQGTGGGGTSWAVQFIGLQYFQDHDHTLNFTTSQNATSDDKRKEFARIFKVGLVTYAAETNIAPNLEVSLKPVAENAPPTRPTRDRWNFWVFRIGAGGEMNGERTNTNKSYRLNFSASRVTEQWKINVSMFGDTSHSSFEVTDDLTVKSTTDSWNLNSLVVKSWGPQWSYGARSTVSHSSFSNTDRSVSAFPAIEFDFFPYSESSRRSLTVQYSAGLTTYRYHELTIFDRLQETVPSHSLHTSLGVRAPWGSLGGSASISQHLNHMDRYRISLNGNTDIRLFKGFSFNIYANYDKIGDQIGLRKADATTEEVLLRLQQRATGYRYYMNFGFNYSFGSIFNSTVNPRFNR